MDRVERRKRDRRAVLTSPAVWRGNNASLSNLNMRNDTSDSF